MPWYEVYDIIEAIHASLSRRGLPGDQVDPDRFERELNRYFRRQGIGWRLHDGKIEIRGPEAFENSVREATKQLTSSGRGTAAKELHEALVDLSRRPEPDVTGAIQHAMAALECAARDVTGEVNLTLGDWIKRNRDAFPRPLDQIVEKLWGFSSEQGRHLQEGRTPAFEDAELVLGLVGTLTTYLAREG